MARKIRVLVVDDSVAVRHALKKVLESDPGIEVMGLAGDPYAAVEYIKREVPDVITLDIEMPRMDGLSFLEKVMSQHPIPIVICSSVTQKPEMAMRALELGAMEVISKPRFDSAQFIAESTIIICDAVKSAAKGRLRQRSAPTVVRPKLSADVMIPPPKPGSVVAETSKIVVIGASTGGTEAIREVLEVLPVNAPGIVIVQHMPEKFTASFAERLDALCEVHVAEARDGDLVEPGKVLIAPGNRHALLARIGKAYRIELRDGPLVSRHRPSVDVLFRSAARCGGKNVVGVIMTGMGDDGAKGMLEMKQSGAFTIAQDEASCVVFGMPGEAVRHGGVNVVLPLSLIPREIMRQAALPAVA